MLKANLQLIIPVFMCVFILKTSAQDRTHFKSLLENAKNPQEKLAALDSLTDPELSADNIDEFIEYSLSYIELAKEMDSIEAASKKMIHVSHALISIKNQPRKVLTLIDGLLARKYAIKNPRVLGNLYLKRGGANTRLDLQQALVDYEKDIQNYGDNDSLFVADAYLFSGHAYSNLGKFVPAGENFQKAYEYFEALKDFEYMFYSRQGVTTMFSMNGFYDKAKKERDKNIEKIQELGLDHHLVVVYYNQALDYNKLGDKDLYLEYLLKAENAIKLVLEDYVNTWNKILVYTSLTEYFAKENNIERAEAYLALLTYNFEKAPDDLINQVNYFGAMAHYYYAINNNKKALQFAKQKLEISKKIGYEEVILDAYEILATVYEANGNYKLSLENRNTFIAIKDSIYNKTTANKLAYYQTLYESEKTENELIEKNTSIQLLEKDNESSKKRLIYSVIALLSIFGMVLLYRNRMRIKSKKNMQEQFSQELLVSQEEERKRIAKDLHDGLGQRLLLIKNNVLQTQDEDTKKLVETAIEEVRSISRNLHPFQLQELGITKAIEHTVNQIDENTSLFITSEIDNIDNIFDKKQEINLYRIIQESLSNVIKHASAEAGKVVVKRHPHMVNISIRDNGVGFDFSEKFENIKSLGLKTMLERTKFLNGQMKVHSKKNRGTLLEFQFPTA
ncbi:MAG: sensor histidine kinase [Flavobacteriaceae bacterium]|nr:sensor histidine kinase [Flavobacteriaceae bacterium]